MRLVKSFGILLLASASSTLFAQPKVVKDTKSLAVDDVTVPTYYGAPSTTPAIGGLYFNALDGNFYGQGLGTALNISSKSALQYVENAPQTISAALGKDAYEFTPPNGSYVVTLDSDFQQGRMVTVYNKSGGNSMSIAANETSIATVAPNTTIQLLCTVSPCTVAADWQVIGLNAASTAQSGVVTTGDQTFSGAKTFIGATSLGADNPGIFVRVISGTTGAAEGDRVSIAHGLDSSKIVGVQMLVFSNGTDGVGPGNTYSAGYQYSVSFDATNINNDLDATNSENILEKTFTAVITYTN